MYATADDPEVLELRFGSEPFTLDLGSYSSAVASGSTDTIFANLDFILKGLGSIL